ncbi:MAG: hypothetical protein EA399_11540 [Desulfovibrionales bacterium]|nr:MAG: hypothetical protein EA399_11540 [Desulfovibrionales bacterium]
MVQSFLNILKMRSGLFMSFVQKVILHKAVVSKIKILSESRKVVGAAHGLFAVASFISPGNPNGMHHHEVVQTPTKVG